jgi:amino acid adenylation domain-containing protein
MPDASPPALDGDQSFPLTLSQLQMWAGQKLNPDVPLYNMAFAFDIKGALCASRFEKAFDALLEEADTMRMVIQETDFDPVQVVRPLVKSDLQQIDFRHTDNPEASAAVWMKQDCQAQFDLSKRNFRTALLRLENERWIWYFNQHHIMCDASSFAVMFRRLSELYEGSLGSGVLTPFRDFVALAHAKDTASGTDTNGADKWTRGGGIPLYGHDRTAPKTENLRITVPLSESQSAAIRALSVHPEWRALSPQMARYQIFLTTLLALQSRVSGQASQTVGSPVHNRPSRAFRNACGLFVEVLPLAVDVVPADSFRSLFQKARDETTAFLRRAGDGKARPSHHQRAFNTILNYITASFGEFAGMQTTHKWLHPDHCDAHHHLRLQVEEYTDSDRIVLHFDLNEAIFDYRARHQVIQHFNELLNSFLNTPDMMIEAVPMLSGSETDELLALGSGPQKAGAEETVIEAFAKQVVATPDAHALRHGDQRLSYRALDVLTSRLAGQLRAAGVGPGDRVALAMQRSCAVVVAMLAVQRAGAAFVPLDPTQPHERLTLLLKNMDARLLLTTEEWRAQLPDGFQTWCLNTTGEAETDVQGASDLPRPTGEDIAYVLYTSGSTGTPKGVAIPHRGLSNYTAWANDTYVRGETLAFALFTPLTFDLTITSIFLPLISGGEVVVYPQSDGPVDFALFDVLEDDSVDIIKLTPSHMRLLKDRSDGPKRFRQMIVGGEDFPVDLAHDMHRVFGENVLLHNEYGPTEATVGCVHHQFDPKTDFTGSVPIGKPIANTQVVVLNNEGQPNPIGVAGELYVSGPGIALGYLNQPDLTAQAFGTDPKTGLPRYRTGDLVRYGADGVLEYLGRIDQQLKVNGVRIEPGEIEAQLRAHPEISDAVVIVKQAPRFQTENLTFCTRCGLPSNFPDATFDAVGQCNICTGFDTYREKAETYFQDMAALRAVFDSGKRDDAPYDCLVLLSGGKDSTYMVGQLAEMGLRILAFTLDNGFISDQAKANIARVVEALGVDHVYAQIPLMNEIFADSLRRHSNVCHGCFKTIYTLSMQMAFERGIPFVVTGLSRGQFFETRLTPDLFQGDSARFTEIDEIVGRARKSYHRHEDAVSRCMDVSAFQGDEIFDAVQIVDFYRYCDVDMDGLMGYLDARLPWVRPSDTGRSTNCLINDVGINVHQREQGYHNYALPYSWDVRMGHKQREAALEELDDTIDETYVEAVLNQVGYIPSKNAGEQVMLVGYYVSDTALDEIALTDYLAQRLPHNMVPARLIHLPRLPLSANGKIDRAALPPPAAKRGPDAGRFVAPASDAERRLAAIWKDVLRLDAVGTKDDFFALGGDSIAAIQIVARANAIGLMLCSADIFDYPTIAGLAKCADGARPITDQSNVTGPTGLNAIQHWFLDGFVKLGTGKIPNLSQVYRANLDAALDIGFTKASLKAIALHHDILRLRLTCVNDEWQAYCIPDAETSVLISQVDLDINAADAVLGLVSKMNATLDMQAGPVLSISLVSHQGGQHLIAVGHHMIIDALSWPILLEDLFSAYRQISNGKDPEFPFKTTSLRDFSHLQQQAALAPEAQDVWSKWQKILKSGPLFASTEQSGQVLGEHSFTLNRVQSTALMDLAQQVYGTMQDVLLAALAKALQNTTGHSKIAVFLEGHGRDTTLANITRTLGWMTDLYPVALDLAVAGHTASELVSYVSQTVKDAGLLTPSYGAMRYLAGCTPEQNVPDVLFNYLGDIKALEPRETGVNVTAPLALEGEIGLEMPFALNVNVILAEGCMKVFLANGTSGPDAGELPSIGEHMQKALVSMINRPASRPVRSPMASSGAADLVKLAGLLKKIDKKG